MHHRNEFVSRLTALVIVLGAGGLAAAGCRQVLGVEDPVPCTTNDECSVEGDPCLLGECVDGACAYSPRAAGFVVDEGETGDCISHVCTADGTVGTLVVVEDVPSDVDGDCMASACSAEGTPSEAPADDPPTTDPPGCAGCDAGMVVDIAGVGCPCMLGTTEDCYTGPTGTVDVGACVDGTATCIADVGGNVFGACTGEVVPTFDSCLAAPDEDCTGSAEACNGNFLFVKSFGSTGGESGSKLIQLSDGSLVATGTFGGSITANNTVTTDGLTDVLVLRLDSMGNAVEARAIGGTAQDSGGQIVATTDGFFLGANLNEPSTETFGGGPSYSPQNTDGFVTKYDNAMAHQWTVQFGGTMQDYVVTFAATSDGGAVVLGSYQSPTIVLGGVSHPNAGSNDLFIVRLGSTGTVSWAKTFGTNNFDEFGGIAIGPNDEIYFSANSQSSIDFGGGGVTIAGGYDAFIVKLDGAGNHIWTKALQSTGDEYGPSLVLQQNGDLWAALSFEAGLNVDGVTGAEVSPVGAGRDIGLVHFNSGGAYVDSVAFDGSGTIFAPNLMVGPDDALVLNGAFDASLTIGTTLTSLGMNDAFLAKLSPSGVPIWFSRYGGSTGGDSFGRGYIDSLGNIFLAGSYAGAVSFGGGNLTNAGMSDIVIAKYHQ